MRDCPSRWLIASLPNRVPMRGFMAQKIPMMVDFGFVDPNWCHQNGSTIQSFPRSAKHPAKCAIHIQVIHAQYKFNNVFPDFRPYFGIAANVCLCGS